MRCSTVEFVARGESALVDLEPPPQSPGAGQVLLETLYSGITNGTERHALMGDHGYGGGYPGRHGYQHICRVAAVGDGVKSVCVGDTVFHGWYVGHRGWHLVPGGTTAALMVKIPAGMSLPSCALLGVAGVAQRAVRRTRVREGQRVWVVGLGPIGISAVQCARAVGAEVTATDLVAARLAVARELGADVVVDTAQADAWDVVGAGGPFDVIMDTSGYPRLFFDVFDRKLLAQAGVVGAIAVRGETSFPWALLHTSEASIEVSCHFDRDDLHRLLEYMGDGRLKLAPIISHLVPITEAPEIYRQMRDDPHSLYGVVFDWTREP